MNEENMELELVEDEVLEPFIPRYSMLNPPPEGRCMAIARSCKHEDCDYIYPENDDTMPECPICKSPRKLCGSFPSVGRNRCRFHGGATLTGISHPSFTGRAISKHLPTRLAQIAELTNRRDKIEFLSFNDDIELLQIRKIDLLHRLDGGDSKQSWYDLSKSMRNYRKYQKGFSSGKSSDGRRMLKEVDTIENLISSGLREYLVWDEIGELMLKQEKLKNSQLKKNKDEEKVITEDDARSLIANFVSILTNRVKDQTLRSLILNDLQSTLMPYKT